MNRANAEASSGSDVSDNENDSDDDELMPQALPTPPDASPTASDASSVLEATAPWDPVLLQPPAVSALNLPPAQPPHLIGRGRRNNRYVITDSDSDAHEEAAAFPQRSHRRRRVLASSDSNGKDTVMQPPALPAVHLPPAQPAQLIGRGRCNNRYVISDSDNDGNEPGPSIGPPRRKNRHIVAKSDSDEDGEGMQALPAASDDAAVPTDAAADMKDTARIRSPSTGGYDGGSEGYTPWSCDDRSQPASPLEARVQRRLRQKTPPRASAAPESASEGALKRRLRQKTPLPEWPAAELHMKALVSSSATPRRKRSRTPRRRCSKTLRTCPGCDDSPCIFSLEVVGGEALRQGATCPWCGPNLLAKACSTAGGREILGRSLQSFRENDDLGIIFDTAVERLPMQWRRLVPHAFLRIPAAFQDEETLAAACADGHGRDQISRFLKRVREKQPLYYDTIKAFLPEDFRENITERAERVKEQLTVSWDEALAYRQRPAAPLTATENLRFKKGVAADKSFVQNKFALHPATGATNDLDASGLPRASSEERTKMLEAWCLRGSWQMCAKCHSVSTKPLRAEDLIKSSKAMYGSTRCNSCAQGKYVPQPADIPQALRGLSPEEVEALRPFDVDIGVERHAQYGYRIKTGMIAFSWKATAVEQDIADLLDAASQSRAQTAFKFLMKCKESRYAFYVEQHKLFLEENQEVIVSKRVRNIRSQRPIAAMIGSQTFEYLCKQRSSACLVSSCIASVAYYRIDLRTCPRTSGDDRCASSKSRASNAPCGHTCIGQLECAKLQSVCLMSAR